MGSMPLLESEMSLSMPAAVADLEGKARKLLARRLTGSMSMSAPIFEAEMSLSIPSLRRLTESISMSAPIFEADMSMGSMPLLESEMSLSIPVAIVEPKDEGLAIAKPEGKARKLRAGHA